MVQTRFVALCSLLVHFLWEKKHQCLIQNSTMMKNNLFAACMVALGIALAGMFVYLGFRCNAEKDRAVVVKGLSTRDVQADYAVWPLSFGVQSDDLPTAYRELNKVTETLKKFLVQKGFLETDLRVGNTTVQDLWNNYYSDRRPDYRYSVERTLVVSTKDVARVVASQGCQSELLNKGIIVNSQEWNLDYQFTGLTELKPSMIEEATKNARAVAQKFADDANCSLGSIRNASQGQFSIESDQFQPWIKHVRVVTTIGYYLN